MKSLALRRADAKQITQRFAKRAVCRFRILAEELEILAVVEQVEKLFIPTLSEQVGAQGEVGASGVDDLTLYFTAEPVLPPRRVLARGCGLTGRP